MLCFKVHDSGVRDEHGTRDDNGVGDEYPSSCLDFHGIDSIPSACLYTQSAKPLVGLLSGGSPCLLLYISHFTPLRGTVAVPLAKKFKQVVRALLKAMVV